MAASIPNSYYGHRLVLDLKAARTKAGLTQTEVADRMHTTTQRISRIEQGQLPNYYEMLAFLKEYDTPPEEWEKYAELLEMAKITPWWHGYGLKGGDLWETKMEDAAYRKEEFQLSYVPELLQTEEYARAVLNSPGWSCAADRVDTLVDARMRRQERLQGKREMKFHAVIHEATLAHELMDQVQLNHLVRVSQHRNITIQIIPFPAQSHLGLRGPFSLFYFEHEESPESACVDSPLGRTEVRTEKDQIRLKEVFDSLQSVALSPRATIKMLRERRQTAIDGRSP
nr:helix-turn-helix transcriptional regulator [Kibdelosporangium sp. MJ126-NF4]